MQKFVFAFALVFCALAMSACTHLPYGPSDDTTDAEFIRAVHAVVDSEEDLKFVNKGLP